MKSDLMNLSDKILATLDITEENQEWDDSQLFKQDMEIFDVQKELILWRVSGHFW